jgi:hypothetical protein
MGRRKGRIIRELRERWPVAGGWARFPHRFRIRAGLASRSRLAPDLSWSCSDAWRCSKRLGPGFSGQPFHSNHSAAKGKNWRGYRQSSGLRGLLCHSQPSTLNHSNNCPAPGHCINIGLNRAGSPSPALRQFNPERIVSLSPALDRQRNRGGGPTLGKHRSRTGNSE